MKKEHFRLRIMFDGGGGELVVFDGVVSEGCVDRPPETPVMRHAFPIYEPSRLTQPGKHILEFWVVDDMPLISQLNGESLPRYIICKPYQEDVCRAILDSTYKKDKVDNAD